MKFFFSCFYCFKYKSLKIGNNENKMDFLIKKETENENTNLFPNKTSFNFPVSCGLRNLYVHLVIVLA